jgi:glycosyltransferase involved in cell wall biosynthesis
MKILHLIDSGGLYGAEQMLLALTEEQIKQDLQPVILSCGLPDEAGKAIEVEAEKRNIPVIKWRMKSGLNFKGAWQIIKFAKKEKIDVIHSHGYKFNILLAIFPRLIRSIPFVTTVHGYVKAKVFSKMWIYEILDRMALKNINFVVAVSNAMTEQKAFYSLNQNKFKVIQNGITSLSKEPSYKGVSNQNKLKIMAVGRLSPEKGFDFLIKAIHELITSGINIELTIFGDGGLMSELSHLTDRLGLSEQILFAGFTKNIPERMKNYDLLVMPSLTEGIPITLLEALRAKIPVCASNVGGIPEVLGTDYPLLFLAGQAEAITQVIKRFSTGSSESHIQLVEQNHERFEELFSAIEMQKKYHNVYSVLVNRVERA